MDTQQEEYENGFYRLEDIPKHLRRYFEPKPLFDFEAIARELYWVTKPGGVVVWVVGDATINGSETGTSFKQALFFKEIGFNLHDTMIYERINAPSVAVLQKRYEQYFEYMFILSKGSPTRCNSLKVQKTYTDRREVKAGKRSSDGSVKRHYDTRDFDSQTKLRGNVWSYAVGYGHVSTDDIAHDHPAIFPEALARDHILSWSSPGDLVLDPMMGSGTTGKMAIKYQRNFVGIEISAEYLEIARKRIELAAAQPLLPGM